MQEICDRIAIFVEGRIVAEGSASELGANMAHGRARFEVAAEATEDDLRRAIKAPSVDIEATGSCKWQVTMDAKAASTLVADLVAAGIHPTGLRVHGSNVGWMVVVLMRAPHP